jgi:hypothetical protein
MSEKKTLDDSNSPFEKKKKEGGERRPQLGGQWKVPMFNGQQKASMLNGPWKVSMLCGQ